MAVPDKFLRVRSLCRKPSVECATNDAGVSRCVSVMLRSLQIG